MLTEVARVGKRGTLVIPAGLRRRFHLVEGSMLVAEETRQGMLLRMATVLPVESYSPERRAEFLLSNAVDAADYTSAAKAVRAMGLDPTRITHRKPAGACRQKALDRSKA